MFGLFEHGPSRELAHEKHTKGGCLLSVHADDGDWAKRAKAVLDRGGAKDVDKTSEASSAKPK